MHTFTYLCKFYTHVYVNFTRVKVCMWTLIHIVNLHMFKYILGLTICKSTFTLEPRHDKTNKMSVHPATTQISLVIHPVWSESSLCAQWVAKDPRFPYVESEDWSDWADAQADLSSLGTHSFCWFCHVMAHLHTYVSEYFLSCERKVNLLMCIFALIDSGCSIYIHGTPVCHISLKLPKSNWR